MSTVQVGEIASQVRGVSYKKPELSDGPAPGYLPVLRANNISDDGLIFDDLVHVDQNRVSPKQRIQSGDIVIAASSGSLSVVGKAAQALEGFEGSFGAFCKVVRPGKAVHPRYLGHYFRTTEYRRRISHLAAGANINNLKNSHIDELEIWLPPLAEQQRIASILDQADALRRLRRQSLSRLSELAQSRFEQAFGGIPATVPLEEAVADTLIGLVRSAEEFGQNFEHPYVRMDAIAKNGFFMTSLVQRTNASNKELNRYQLNDGDLLFNTRNSRELVGKTTIFRGMPGAIYNNNIMRIRFGKGWDPVFVEAYFRSALGRGELEQRKSGTTSVWAVYWSKLKSFPLPQVRHEKQLEFRKFVETIWLEEEKYSVELKNYDRLFTSLQHRAFRGEL